MMSMSNLFITSMIDFWYKDQVTNTVSDTKRIQLAGPSDLSGAHLVISQYGRHDWTLRAPIGSLVGIHETTHAILNLENVIVDGVDVVVKRERVIGGNQTG